MAKSKKKNSKPVKLSNEVIGYINMRKLRKGEKNCESFDAALRRFFGLSSLDGQEQKLRTYFVLPNGDEPLIFLTRAEARGAAIVRAVRKGTKKAEPVLEVKELP